MQTLLVSLPQAVCFCKLLCPLGQVGPQLQELFRQRLALLEANTKSSVIFQSASAGPLSCIVLVYGTTCCCTSWSQLSLLFGTSSMFSSLRQKHLQKHPYACELVHRRAAISIEHNLRGTCRTSADDCLLCSAAGNPCHRALGASH